MSKHVISVNDSVTYIENDEFENVIVNNIVNNGFLYLNKAQNHTPENEIEKEYIVVSIHHYNELMHLNTNGRYYNWNSGRKDGAYSSIRFDKAICI